MSALISPAVADRDAAIPLHEVPPPLPGASLAIGWRPYRVISPSGELGWHNRPMNAAEWLFPSGEDVIPADIYHQTVVGRGFARFESLTRGRAGVWLLMDSLVNGPERRATAPDLALIGGCDPTVKSGSFDFRDHPGAVPPLVVEVVSPNSTREKDLNEKVDIDALGRARQYVVVDRVTLLSWRLEGGDYVETDGRGWFPLLELNAWIGLEGGEVEIYDGLGRLMVLDHEAPRERDDALQLAKAEKQRAEAEKHRADDALQLAKAEKQRADEALQLTEAERQRADEAIQRAETADQRAEAERRRVAEAESLIASLLVRIREAGLSAE